MDDFILQLPQKVFSKSEFLNWLRKNGCHINYKTLIKRIKAANDYYNPDKAAELEDFKARYQLKGYEIRAFMEEWF